MPSWIVYIKFNVGLLLRTSKQMLPGVWRAAGINAVYSVYFTQRGYLSADKKELWRQTTKTKNIENDTSGSEHAPADTIARVRELLKQMDAKHKAALAAL